jgi:TRAP-type C4-dicarboxylate transport system permease small subunit
MNSAARVLGLAFASVVMFVFGSGAAWADEPSTWAEEPGRSTLDTLLLFGGGTIGLIVLISLFALLTARNNYVPPPPSTELEKADDHTPATH